MWVQRYVTPTLTSVGLAVNFINSVRSTRLLPTWSVSVHVHITTVYHAITGTLYSYLVPGLLLNVSHSNAVNTC
jgi:hypothetical protein